MARRVALANPLMKTHVLAAYVDSRRMTLAGVPITWTGLVGMLKLPASTLTNGYVSDAALQAIAGYLRLPVYKLYAAIAQMPMPAPKLSPSAVLAGKPTQPAQTLEIPVSELAPLIAASRQTPLPFEPVAQSRVDSRAKKLGER